MTGERLRLLSFKPLRRGSLVGFATIELPIGLKIIDVPVLESHGKAWASLPSKPRLDRDGQPIRHDCKVAYAAILEWTSKKLRDAFSQRVVEAVRAQHPQAFDQGESP